VNVGLVGLGHIGGSLGLALRARGARVVGRDRDAAVAERARGLGIVDEVGEVGGADVVVLAVPVLAIPACAAELHIGGETVVTDVGSTKRSVVAGCEALFGGRFVGGHPMAGSERAGPEAADAKLFTGRRVLLTPTARTDARAVAAVTEMWRSVGAEVLALDAARHDRMIAAVSHLPHAVAYALVGALAGMADELRGLSGGGFVDTTRIASTPAPMWVDVFIDNRDMLLELIDRFSDRLGALRAAIAAGDAAELGRTIDEARRARAAILG
jgi:prephenate dehydrogenase